MNSIFAYVVTRDYGFAPNPFHGFLTLATCKPRIRRVAQKGDLLLGLASRSKGQTERCIYIARVAEKLSFEEYWNDPRFMSKKPVRNGSSVMLVGDNIYQPAPDGGWIQSSSHHSHADGSCNHTNLRRDTSANAVLVSQNFLYFGGNVVEVPNDVVAKIAMVNRRGHRRIAMSIFNSAILSWVEELFLSSQHSPRILGDPKMFGAAGDHYSGTGSAVIARYSK